VRHAYEFLIGRPKEERTRKRKILRCNVPFKMQTTTALANFGDIKITTQISCFLVSVC
jgi:hypothetical protein